MMFRYCDPVEVAVLPSGRPKSVRKLRKSCGLMSVSPTMAMVCPVPSMGVEADWSGLTS